MQIFDRLQLDDNQAIHNEIGAEAFVKRESFESNGNSYLPLDDQPGVSNLRARIASYTVSNKPDRETDAA